MDMSVNEASHYDFTLARFDQWDCRINLIVIGDRSYNAVLDMNCRWCDILR
jgi:hypothetical protein